MVEVAKDVAESQLIDAVQGLPETATANDD